MIPQPSPQQLQSQIDTFNKAYKVGDVVKVRKLRSSDEGIFTDKIRHEATILGGHTAVTWLEVKGSYDLTFVIGLA